MTYRLFHSPWFVALIFGVLILLADHILSPDSLKIVDSIQEGDTVRYAYVGEQVPGLLEENEIVEKRTGSSYTVYLGKDEEGRDTYRARIYTQSAFVKDGLAWHVVEYGRDTQENFLVKTRPSIASRIARVIVPPTYAVPILSGTGDESVGSSASTWDAAHDALTGGNFGADGDTARMPVSSLNFDTTTFLIIRAFLPFNTGGTIPSNATITGASLSVVVAEDSVFSDDNDGDDFVTVVRTSQATHTTTALADFDQAGAIDNPTEGIDTGQRRSIPSITPNATVTFTLNATGLGWIAKSGESSNCSATSGWTCLGLREGHDVKDSSILVNRSSLVHFWPSERTGTTQDPTLDVTFTAVSAPTIVTDAVSSVGSNSATLNGSVTNNGTEDPTTCGFAWGTNAGLSGGDTATTTDSTCPSGTGAFSKNLTSLSLATTYYFRAYATNSGGTGFGNIENFTTTAGLPDAPTNLVANVSGAGVVLTWNAPTDTGASGIASYNIYRDTSPLPTTLFFQQTSGTSSQTYTDTTATGGMPFFYRVTAENTQGESGFSNQANGLLTTARTIRLKGGIRFIGGVRLR